jgi:hypothetical protein
VHSEFAFPTEKGQAAVSLFQGWAASGGASAHRESNKVRQQPSPLFVCSRLLAEGCAFLKSLITGEECVSLQSAESIKGGNVV